jgi:predicted transcriptional regulator
MDEELVEETVSGDSRRYTITEKGKNVLKTPSLLEAGRYKKNAANETA